MSSYSLLKARQRRERGTWPDNLSIRVHRSLSWLQRSELCDDDDGTFLFSWISFNAAYAQEVTETPRVAERARYGAFVEKLVTLDRDQRLYQLSWSEFSGAFRVLLANKYVFSAFWDYQANLCEEHEWRETFRLANTAANKALAKGDTAVILAIVLSRLYVLRNQLMHGGATWNGAINREQVRDAAAIMARLVPEILNIMMDHPDTLWGSPAFPVVS